MNSVTMSLRTMSWAEAVTESTRKPTRQPLNTYVPPHHRYNGGSYGHTSSFTESTQYGFQPSYAGGGYRGGGRTGPSRGGGRGGRAGGYGGRSRGWSQSSNPSPYPKPNRDPFHDVSEKFEQLQVSEEDSNVGINFDAYEDIPVDASGEDVPPPVNTFQDIDLGDCLNNNIKRCRYVKPTPVQRHAIPIAMAGRDLMACAQTGSGKTAAFCFPIISGVLTKCLSRSQSPGDGWTVFPSALILSPTRELASQVCVFLRFLVGLWCLSNFVLDLMLLICFEQMCCFLW